MIDKDRCSERLAVDIHADILVLLTGVPQVSLDFGTRWERKLSTLTVADVERGLREGDFPAGSMGPKMESAARFVEESAHGRALITNAEQPGRGGQRRRRHVGHAAAAGGRMSGDARLAARVAASTRPGGSYSRAQRVPQ